MENGHTITPADLAGFDAERSEKQTLGSVVYDFVIVLLLVKPVAFIVPFIVQLIQQLFV